MQDQFDPEFYLKVYHSRHKQTNTEVIKVVAKIGSDFIFNCMCFVCCSLGTVGCTEMSQNNRLVYSESEIEWFLFLYLKFNAKLSFFAG